MTKQVMTKAWEIADAAAAIFGGKAIGYIGGSLKLAWSIIKKQTKAAVKTMQLELIWSNRQPVWVAEVTGLDQQFGFKRNFLNEIAGDWHDKTFELTEGRYYSWKAQRVQHFGQVVNGELVEMTKGALEKIFAK